MIDYYQGDNTMQYIKNYFNAKAFKEVPLVSFNITKRFINKMSRIYTLGANRTLAGKDKQYHDMAHLKDFKMKGGVGYTLIPENREAGAMWASDDVGINSDIISKIKQGVRFGLTYLMGPDSHLSNRAFWKIYEGETQWGLDKGDIDLERLNARIQEMIDKGNADVKAWKEIGLQFKNSF